MLNVLIAIFLLILGYIFGCIVTIKRIKARKEDNYENDT